MNRKVFSSQVHEVKKVIANLQKEFEEEMMSVMHHDELKVLQLMDKIGSKYDTERYKRVEAFFQENKRMKDTTSESDIKSDTKSEKETTTTTTTNIPENQSIIPVAFVIPEYDYMFSFVLDTFVLPRYNKNTGDLKEKHNEFITEMNTYGYADNIEYQKNTYYNGIIKILKYAEKYAKHSKLSKNPIINHGDTFVKDMIIYFENIHKNFFDQENFERFFKKLKAIQAYEVRNITVYFYEHNKYGKNKYCTFCDILSDFKDIVYHKYIFRINENNPDRFINLVNEDEDAPSTDTNGDACDFNQNERDDNADNDENTNNDENDNADNDDNADNVNNADNYYGKNNNDEPEYETDMSEEL